MPIHDSPFTFFDKKENETKESVFFHFLSGIFPFHFLSGKKENETKESASLRLFCEMRDFAGLGSQVHWTCSHDEMAKICTSGAKATKLALASK